MRHRRKMRATPHSLLVTPYPSLLGFGEDITRTADGDDAPRLSWIVLDRRADAGNMHVDRPVEPFDLFALNRAHRRVTGHEAACMLGERRQQGELIPGERARRAVKPHFAGAAVALETPVTQQVGFGPAPPTAQDRAQSRQKLAR